MLSGITLLLLALVPLLFYLFLTWNYNYWNKRGVRGPKPKLILGTFPSLFNQKQNFGVDIFDIYNAYKKTDNYVGVYLMRDPQLLILDPKLAYEVFVTAFKNFHDNYLTRMVDKKKDSLFAKNPFIQNGEDWKFQRTSISPGLTASRVKAVYSIMQDVCDSFCEFIEKEIKLATPNGINGRELAIRFTSENICDSVLRIKARSFTDDPIPIEEHVKAFSEHNIAFSIAFVISGFLPMITKFYKVRFMKKKHYDFFFGLMKQAFDIRTTKSLDRQDFMDHLLSLKSKQNLSDIELASHSMTFLIDGLDTSSTAIAHCLLLLGRYPETQKKLYEEIIQNADENGKLSFEKLNELPYLDACFNESLRIFPPASWFAKTCTEPYEFTNKNGDKLRVDVGQTILISSYGLQNDPEYFPEPEIFKPERFLEENNGDAKKFRDMGIFFPFGNGPRICMGMRYALTQSKCAIATVVKNFNIKVNPKTKKENKLDPKAFLTLQDGGVWLDFEKRL